MFKFIEKYEIQIVLTVIGIAFISIIIMLDILGIINVK